MTYNNESHIKSVEDIKTFFHHFVDERKVNFHPDDRFEDYVSCEDESKTFTQNECAVYNHLMDKCIEVCEKNGADIYAIGFDLMQEALV